MQVQVPALDQSSGERPEPAATERTEGRQERELERRVAQVAQRHQEGPEGRRTQAAGEVVETDGHDHPREIVAGRGQPRIEQIAHRLQQAEHNQ